MKTITISVVAMLRYSLFQSPERKIRALRSAGTDLLAGLVGDMVRFERGMRTLEDILSKNLHGNGQMARAGEAFKIGNNEKAIKLWQSGLDEMAQAVEEAPDLRNLVRNLKP
jgi:hypothetical protein